MQDEATTCVMERDEAQRAFDMAANFMTPDDVARGVPGMRKAYERFLTGFAVDPGTAVHGVDANGVACLVVTARPDLPIRAIHFHGGGYMVGSARGSVEYASRVSRAIDAAVLVVDYRLAPEHAYPAAVLDAKAAYDWLSAQTAGPLLVSGESAGAGLAVALGMTCRDAGHARMPAGYFLLSPFADLAIEGESVAVFGPRDPFANHDMLSNLANAYLQGQDAKAPLASPIYGNLEGLGPVVIACSEVEALRSDSERLQGALTAAGVNSRLLLYPDTLHIFGIFPFLPESDALMAELATFGEKALGSGPIDVSAAI